MGSTFTDAKGLHVHCTGRYRRLIETTVIERKNTRKQIALRLGSLKADAHLKDFVGAEYWETDSQRPGAVPPHQPREPCFTPLP